MLEINGLETAYGQSQVLFGMQLSVGEGEVVTLLLLPQLIMIGL